MFSLGIMPRFTELNSNYSRVQVETGDGGEGRFGEFYAMEVCRE